MLKHFLSLALLSGVLASSVSSQADPVASPSQSDLRWKKAVAGRVEVHDMNGSIRAEAASGDELEIVANKSGRDAARVTVVVKEVDGVVVACALWPGDTNCAPGAKPRSNGESVDARVDFALRVPVKVTALATGTMNGAVTVRSVAAALTARTMNGAIDVASTGSVDAETMNGSVQAQVAKGQPAKLSSKNGRVEIALSGDSNADVAASTMHGKITSAFGTVPPAPFPGISNSATLRIGSGGTAIALETMNGDIAVRRM